MLNPPQDDNGYPLKSQHIIAHPISPMTISYPVFYDYIHAPISDASYSVYCIHCTMLYVNKTI